MMSTSSLQYDLLVYFTHSMVDENAPCGLTRNRKCSEAGNSTCSGTVTNGVTSSTSYKTVTHCFVDRIIL